MAVDQRLDAFADGMGVHIDDGHAIHLYFNSVRRPVGRQRVFAQDFIIAHRGVGKADRYAGSVLSYCPDARPARSLGCIPGRRRPMRCRDSVRPADRQPLALQTKNDSFEICTITGARPSDGSSIRISCGSIISARPTASMPRSPPDTVRRGDVAAPQGGGKFRTHDRQSSHPWAARSSAW